MDQDLDHVLDESLTLLREGRATLEECLARYPEHAAELRPLLGLALQVHRLPKPTARPAAFAAGKQRMLQALAEKKRRQARPSSRPARWLSGLLGAIARPAPRLGLAVVGALILLIASGLLLRSWLGATVVQAATLAQASGVVEVMPAGEDTWRPVAAGERLEVGDRVRTGPASAAQLRFFDGSMADLGAETEITLAQMSARRDGGDRLILLHQWVGRTYHRVQRLPDPDSRYKVETPTAVTVVRGTEFAVVVEADGTTEVVVVQGKVDVIAQATTVQVPAGQKTTVQPEEPPAPIHPATPVSPTPWAAPTPTPTSTPTALPTPTLTPTSPQPSPEMPAPEHSPEPTHTPEPTETEEPGEEHDGGGEAEPTHTPEHPPEMTHTPEPTETEEPTEEPEDGDEHPEPTETPEPTEESDEGDEDSEPTETPEPTHTPEPTKTPRGH